MTTSNAAAETVSVGMARAVRDTAQYARDLVRTRPAGEPADLTARRLVIHLERLVALARRRLTRLPRATPTQRRQRDVLSHTLAHAQSVYLDEAQRLHANPVTRLELLSGACQLLLDQVEGGEAGQEAER